MRTWQLGEALSGQLAPWIYNETYQQHPIWCHGSRDMASPEPCWFILTVREEYVLIGSIICKNSPYHPNLGEFESSASLRPELYLLENNIYGVIKS